MPLPSTTQLIGSSLTITGKPVSSRKQHVDVLEQRAAAGEHDALVHDVRGQLGRRALEREQHGFDDRVDRLGQRLADLVGVDDHGLGNAGHHVAALDLHRHLLLELVGVADGDLDALGGLLADGQVVLALHVRDDGFVHLVAADAHALRVDDAGQRDDGDLGRAAADVDDHVAARLGDGQAAPMAAAIGSSIR